MNNSIDAPILQQVAAHYTSKLQTHGPTSQGVDWNDLHSHEARHRQFLRLIEGVPDASIIDLGCGFGDFLRFLRLAGHRGRFVGYDIAPSMIDKARELHGEGDDRQWHVGSTPSEAADFAVASGIFNVKGDIPSATWSSYVLQTIDGLAQTGRRGFGFNVLSMSSDPDRRRPDLYYAEPAEMLSHCLSRYGRSVALLQDYGRYEFTIIVRTSASKTA
ncbi:class I SAM-dependent methyltransferase [Bradyrhizobium diazoefficiens]|nr:class I SAM-dependent methyltransferase [Bradyrhizobium diazoefficiens]QQN62767.1 class I SAM-dependent methyltransferase [Bradyrhizobium diazoefficiens]